MTSRIHSHVSSPPFSSDAATSPAEPEQEPTRLENTLGWKENAPVLLDAVFESAAVGLAVFNTHFRFIRVNRKLADMNGSPPEAHVGRRVMEMLPSDIAGQMLYPIQRVMETGEAIRDVEISGRIGDRPLHWLANFSPVFSGSGGIQGVSASISDIMAIRRIENSLEKKTLRLRSLVGRSPLGIAAFRPDGVIQYANPAMLAFMGLQDTDAMSLLESYNILTDPYAEEIGIAHFIREAFTGRTVTLPLFFYDARRSWFAPFIPPKTAWLEGFACPVVTPEGKVMEVVLLFKDKTEQKTAELEARESDLRLRTVLDAIHEGVMMYDRDGRVLFWNKAAEYLMGAGESTGQWRLVHEDDTPWSGEEHPAMTTLKTGHPLKNVEMKLVRDQEPPRWISVNVQPLFRDHETMPHAVAISFSDITERKKAFREPDGLESRSGPVR